MGQKKVSLLVRCPHFRDMQEWYILGVGKDVLLERCQVIKAYTQILVAQYKSVFLSL